MIHLFDLNMQDIFALVVLLIAWLGVGKMYDNDMFTDNATIHYIFCPVIVGAIGTLFFAVVAAFLGAIWLIFWAIEYVFYAPA